MAIWIPSLISFASAVCVVLITLRGNRLADQGRTIFERRASVLAKVYTSLVAAYQAYEEFLQSGTRFAWAPGPEERHREAVLAGERFQKVYTRARILIPPLLADILDDLDRDFVSMAKLYIVGRSLGEDENQALMRAYLDTEGKVKIALPEVTKAFRAAIEGRVEPKDRKRVAI